MSLRNITDTIPIQREKLTGKGGNLAVIPRIAIFLPTFFHSYHFEMGKRPYETLPIVERKWLPVVFEGTLAMSNVTRFACMKCTLFCFHLFQTKTAVMK